MYTATKAATQLPMVEVNGQRLAYLEQGKGQPVIFVHGGLFDYRQWSFQMEPFGRRYRAIAYSRRYHYPNPSTGNGMDSGISENASDLASLITKLGLAPAHLVGQSWGAFTVLYFALKNPELVRTLTAIEPPAIPLLLKDYRKPSLGEIVSLFLKSPSTASSFVNMGMNTIKPVQEAVRRGDYLGANSKFFDWIHAQKGYFEKVPEQVRAIMMDNLEAIKGEWEMVPFSLDDAQRITSPTLLVNGGRSPKLLQYIVDLLVTHMPNGEKVTISNAAHSPQWENPDAFNKVALEFLEKHS